MKHLAAISPDALGALARAFRDGPLQSTDRKTEYAALCGMTQAEVIMGDIVALRKSGFQSIHLATLLEGMAEAKRACMSPAELFDLVMTGPSQENIPIADTQSTIRELMEKAESELTLVGYAIHNGKKVFEGLANRMCERPKLKVRLFINIARPQHDNSSASEIVSRFEHDFRTKHWPWEHRPEVFHYAPALDLSDTSRPSLHAKCVIADGNTALITSANFTEAAMERNLEAGILIRHPATAKRLCTYLETLQSQGLFARCPTL